MADSRERFAEFLLRRHRFNHSNIEFFGQVEDVFFFNEAHLQVQLRELQLTVSTQIFVTEASGDLEITFYASHHEQLLHLLWRLRQSVETSGLHSAGHEEVAGAFRGALDENRSLYLQKIPVIQEIANVFNYVMPQCHVAQHGRAAQVQVSVTQTQAFISLSLIVNVERRR